MLQFVLSLSPLNLDPFAFEFLLAVVVDDHLALLALAMAGHVLVLDFEPPVHVHQDHVLVALVQARLILGLLHVAPVLELGWLHFGGNVKSEVEVIEDDLPFLLVTLAVLAIIMLLEDAGQAVDQRLQVLERILLNLLQVHEVDLIVLERRLLATDNFSLEPVRVLALGRCELTPCSLGVRREVIVVLVIVGAHTFLHVIFVNLHVSSLDTLTVVLIKILFNYTRR